ncbi:hypothetical protein FRC00_010427 [Tulasnella sp. 408]|nr:hypothetical protein FRC00_010427 [Tulasnella sp. 408]
MAVDGIPEGSTSSQADSNLRILGLALEEPGFTLIWASPEVLNEGQRDLPSDMWALGWICWEIVTGKIPYEDLKNDADVMESIIEGRLAVIREDPQLSQVLQLCNLMSECWISAPHHRPSKTPSSWVDARGRKVRSADLLLELGRMYSLQNDTMLAEARYQMAIDVAVLTKDDTTMANALIGLGEVYKAQSKYSEAENAFVEARAILSRINNDTGLELR